MAHERSSATLRHVTQVERETAKAEVCPSFRGPSGHFCALFPYSGWACVCDAPIPAPLHLCGCSNGDTLFRIAPDHVKCASGRVQHSLRASRAESDACVL